MPDALGVVREQLLVDHAEGGEQPDAVDALVVHHPQAGVAVAVLRPDGLARGEVLLRPLARRVAPEVLGQRAGLGDRVERGVDDGAAHAPADHVVLAASDVGPLDDARPEPGSRWRVNASSAS